MRTAVLLTLALSLPLFAQAALININTADATLLDTLPHIGPVTAQKIIDYRTANGPFLVITDLQKVSGIGSGSNYADIAPLITVGDVSGTSNSSSSNTNASSTPDTASATTPPTAASSDNRPPEYLPIPTLHLITSDSRTVSSGAETVFSAVVYDGKGNKRDDALVTWSFGDGMRKTGASVFHQYYNSGEYITIVRARTPDGGNTQEEIAVTVSDAHISIASVTARGIGLKNNSTRVLDLSFWRLSMGGHEFKIPEDTGILPGHTVLFASQVIELPLAASASLLYPSGEMATSYPPASAQQLSAGAVSYKQVSEVEPIPSASTNIQAHDEAVDAPTAAIGPAAVGAVQSSESSVSAVSRFSGIFTSPWTLGFLGVVALAGSAFIFL